ncbi:MAG: hypothetical protein HYU76_09350 [Betaproteobacteria bacterium]|nr:hypothetical protein [Betaproteobacteria bacterium]MBI2509739.1 hypothetical protein [Betaproteobacteria bacterium]
MTLVIDIISGLFIVLCVAMLFAYARGGHFGVFLMGLTYGAAAAGALWLNDWWPLAGGFALVWLYRWLGLEPEPGDRDR